MKTKSASFATTQPSGFFFIRNLNKAVDLNSAPLIKQTVRDGCRYAMAPFRRTDHFERFSVAQL